MSALRSVRKLWTFVRWFLITSGSVGMLFLLGFAVAYLLWRLGVPMEKSIFGIALTAAILAFIAFCMEGWILSSGIILSFAGGMLYAAEFVAMEPVHVVERGTWFGAVGLGFFFIALTSAAFMWCAAKEKRERLEHSRITPTPSTSL